MKKKNTHSYVYYAEIPRSDEDAGIPVFGQVISSPKVDLTEYGFDEVIGSIDIVVFHDSYYYLFPGGYLFDETDNIYLRCLETHSRLTAPVDLAAFGFESEDITALASRNTTLTCRQLNKWEIPEELLKRA